MALIYGLTFCRLVIGLVFALSALHKARNIPAFSQAIVSFKLLPRHYVTITIWLVLGGECTVAFLMLIGGPTLWAGFTCAIMLLLVFSAALWSIIARKIHTSCNCFGPSARFASPADLWRNVGLILSALGGCVALAASEDGTASLGPVEWAVIGLAAATFALVWVRIGDIVHILQRSQ